MGDRSSGAGAIDTFFFAVLGLGRGDSAASGRSGLEVLRCRVTRGDAFLLAVFALVELGLRGMGGGENEKLSDDTGGRGGGGGVALDPRGAWPKQCDKGVLLLPTDAGIDVGVTSAIS